MSAEQDKSKQDKSKKLSQEAIISGFNQLRQEQRMLLSKVADLEMELSEHNLVVNALKDVQEERKCYRMIGGVLVERTVKEVLPAVENNKNQIAVVVDSLNQQVQSKGKEINEYREKYNIQLKGEPLSNAPLLNRGDQPAQPASSVLVEQKS